MKIIRTRDRATQLEHLAQAQQSAPSVNYSDEEWRERLTPQQYLVLRQAGTEAPWTGELLDEHRSGTYLCAACGAQLFPSSTKFESHCGWPSFYEALPGAVNYFEDISHGMRRIEVRCASCDSHLGHIFDDAPNQPTGNRFCMNSVCLQFVPDPVASWGSALPSSCASFTRSRAHSNCWCCT